LELGFHSAGFGKVSLDASITVTLPDHYLHVPWQHEFNHHAFGTDTPFSQQNQTIVFHFFGPHEGIKFMVHFIISDITAGQPFNSPFLKRYTHSPSFHLIWSQRPSAGQKGSRLRISILLSVPSSETVPTPTVIGCNRPLPTSHRSPMPAAAARGLPGPTRSGISNPSILSHLILSPYFISMLEDLLKHGLWITAPHRRFVHNMMRRLSGIS
jgi:hypothetical protein